jgi:hypothetical protein
MGMNLQENEVGMAEIVLFREVCMSSVSIKKSFMEHFKFELSYSVKYTTQKSFRSSVKLFAPVPPQPPVLLGYLHLPATQ